MAIRLGMDAKLYYKTGGISGLGSWLPLGNTKDVTLNLETGEADVTTRANQGWRWSSYPNWPNACVSLAG